MAVKGDHELCFGHYRPREWISRASTLRENLASGSGGVIRGNNAFWKIGRRVTAPRSARLKAGLEYALLLT
jgi:hypothetical protein